MVGLACLSTLIYQQRRHHRSAIVVSTVLLKLLQLIRGLRQMAEVPASTVRHRFAITNEAQTSKSRHI